MAAAATVAPEGQQLLIPERASLLDFLQDPLSLPVGVRLRDLERKNTGFKSTHRGTTNRSSANVSEGTSQ
ncbi:hypothetical protein IscW_ISCW022803 [Ixodes scapularis]|uniref:Uncharacterized protein n=1 Tax=Ixodes scapularis TaxID=6945 RepID=B7QES8_IXOSC|nr:hypothetical protein IscW_ISCW022803 [Ixodes scapularis]|eukprot:XP_002414042.1 hypothetical protein IscW_ISCW022803 [Ixodes scapularis]